MNSLNPISDMLWYDPSTKTIQLYGGNSWQSIAPVSRIDLSNATNDYMLHVGEEAIINFSNVSSIPLHIATQSGTYYKLSLVLSNPAGASGGNPAIITLYPNNTTYSSAFSYVEVYRTAGDSSAGSSTATYNEFRLGSFIASTKSYITNFTTNKHIETIYSFTGSSIAPAININTCYWNDNTTPWTSLGTVGFPQSYSGYILVRRLV